MKSGWTKARLEDKPHWVYRMFDEAGELLYVGYTYNPEQRLAAWRGCVTDHWYWRVRLVSWSGPYPTRTAGRLAETAANRHRVADVQPMPQPPPGRRMILSPFRILVGVTLGTPWVVLLALVVA